MEQNQLGLGPLLTEEERQRLVERLTTSVGRAPDAIEVERAVAWARQTKANNMLLESALHGGLGMTVVEGRVYFLPPGAEPPRRRGGRPRKVPPNGAVRRRGRPPATR